MLLKAYTQGAGQERLPFRNGICAKLSRMRKRECDMFETKKIVERVLRQRVTNTSHRRKVSAVVGPGYRKVMGSKSGAF